MPRLSPTVHSADRNLVKGLNDGDETAFAALYDEYGERLYDYALSMTGETKVAADIVHDTFIDACRRAPRLRDHLHLSSWLYGAARRRCVRRGRSKVLFWDRDGEFSDIPFLDRAEPEAPVPDWPPSDELHELFQGALGELEPVQQEVMLLAYRHGLRPGRLGATLGLSSRRAAMRVRTGRAELAAALQKELDRANRACAARAAAPEPDAAGVPAAQVSATGAPVTAPPVAGTPTTGGRHRRDASAPPEPAADRSATESVSTESAPSEVLGSGRPSGGRLARLLRRRPEVSAADPATERHAADCPDCRRRGRVTAAGLFRRAPAPVLPAALRHRFMHTATDPELAGYRADIAARGGALTPSGLPSQPDVPSPFTRRWMSTVAIMTVGLAAALAAFVTIGPGVGGGPLSWPPFRTEPQPSITHVPPPNGSSTGTEPPRAPGAGAPVRPVQPPPLQPQTEEDGRGPSPTPTSPPQSSAPPADGPGKLVVNPGKVELFGTKTAEVSLEAESGPVTWTAETSSSQLVLSETEGGIEKDGTIQVTLTLRTFLIGLPGEGTLTFTDQEGEEQTVKVVWGASLL